uniref:Uncharacterized protein n=1 Tax=Oryza glaberrima TaxID=4538 RepID=I1PSS0_ORYGL
MSGTGCFPVGEMAAVARVCRDGAAAARLKTGSLLAILVASAVGICLPVALTGAFRGKAGYARGLLLVKCYAAGVILSTSLVHVLPDAHAALADCAVATRRPWRDFPFAGLFSLVGALLALLVDLSASSHLEAHGHHQHAEEGESPPPTHQPYAPIPTTKKSPVFELSGEMSPKKRAHSDDTDRDDVALFGAKSAARSDEVVVAPRVGCHGHDVVEVGEEGGGGGGGGGEEEAEDGVQGARDWDRIPLGHHRGHHGDVSGCLRHPAARRRALLPPGVRRNGPRRLHCAGWFWDCNGGLHVRNVLGDNTIGNTSWNGNIPYDWL